MNRIRTAIIYIRNLDLQIVESQIEGLGGVIISRTSSSELNTKLLFHLPSNFWDQYEDTILPTFSTWVSGESSGYTETCVYTKTEIANAKYLVLEFTHSPFDIEYREFYNFSEYQINAFGRPKAWASKIQPPVASGLRISKLTRAIGITRMGAVLVRDDVVSDITLHCNNELIFTKIVDDSRNDELPWSSLWSTMRMPSMPCDATGILHEGSAPEGVRGGSSCVFDTRKEGYRPAYTQEQIDSVACGGTLDIAFTRECYGPWVSDIESVLVAPYPKMVVSNKIYCIIKKHSPRGVNCIPIQIV